MRNISSLWWDSGNYYEISINGADIGSGSINCIDHIHISAIGYENSDDYARQFRVSSLGTIKMPLTLIGTKSIGSVG